MSNSEEDGWRRFLDLCLKSDSLEALDALFHVAFTHAERHEIAFRILIFRDLIRGEKTQREIASDLSVSLAIVSRGSNALKTMDPELRKKLSS